MRDHLRLGIAISLALLLLSVNSLQARLGWGECGVRICLEEVHGAPKAMVSDASGGVICFFTGTGIWGDYDFHAQRIDPYGNRLWGPQGVPISLRRGIDDAFVFRGAIPDGAGGAIVGWENWRRGGIPDTVQCFIQRIDADGTALWEPNGIALGVPDSRLPQVVTDGAGGAIVLYGQGRGRRGQKIGADGSLLWPPDGLVFPAILLNSWISDGAGGAIGAWGGWTEPLSAQRFDPNGNALWGSPGVILAPLDPSRSVFPFAETDGAGGAIIAWKSRLHIPAQPGEADIRAQRVDADGNVLWQPNGITLCTATADTLGPGNPIVTADGAGGAVVTWVDIRAGNFDLFAQRIDAAGNALWTSNGVAVCAAPGRQWYQRVEADSTGGVLITWADGRGIDYDVYAQRLDGNGASLWNANGIPICAATDHQSGPRLAFSSPSVAIISWVDLRSGEPQTYAQRVDLEFGQQGNFVECPNDTIIPAFSTVPSLVLNGFRITNAETVDLAFDYFLTAEGPALLVDNGDPNSLSGTTLTLSPGETATPPAAALQIPEIRTYSQEIVTYHVSAVGDPSVADSCTAVVTFDPPVPVLISSFEAIAIDAGIELKWDIFSDEDVRGFQIYRSIAGDETSKVINSPLISPESKTYVDLKVRAGWTYNYALAVIMENGTEVMSRIANVRAKSHSLGLFQNYPNPFNPTTMISYTLPAEATVDLSVFNVGGKLVKTLVSGVMDGGYNEVSWDGSDVTGNSVSSGIYFYRLKTGRRTFTKKMVLLR